ncbi:MAG: DUF1015 domain-containing protein [Candidatus Omnitrophica bacterium]|nr:DUF1015 domain-containing protein [Candidatus Omnitrophota bacterium]
MAEIRPFRGLVYNGGKISGGYESVMAPPYDVIPEAMREELYGQNEHNVIRLILGKSFEGDDQQNNQYTRAREFFNKWQDEKILVKDDKESFYVYQQEYGYRGRKYNRLGFFGLMKIEEEGEQTVLPHEHTLAKPKEDRMNLIKQVESNLSPIFTLYEDATRAVMETIKKETESSRPVIDIEVDGETHRLWRLSDEESIKTIISGMDGKKVFIADGHHRYEVARKYRDMRRQQDGYDGDADFIMMYFTDLEDTDNLTIMATHRAVKKMPTQDENEIKDSLSGYFDITECRDLAELMEKLDAEAYQIHRFGFFGGSKYLFMRPKSESGLKDIIQGDRAEAWKELDVSAFHAAVLEKILNADNIEGNITYLRDPEEAEALVKDGSHMAAFLLNPTRVKQLRDVAELGEMMPQKSTYFYPKLLTGLVINKFAVEKNAKVSS